MTPSPLPVILSVPHGGLLVPPEVEGQLAIDATTIYNECDLWVDQLFDFRSPSLFEAKPSREGPGVLAAVHMPIARVLIDANRPPDGMDDPDGPVKTTTSYGQSIHRVPLAPALRRELLESYWSPFHDALTRAVSQHKETCRLILDCHNMAQEGPTAYGDAGKPRPFICLANLGNAQGEQVAGGEPVTCPPSLIQAAATLAEETFGDLQLLEPHGLRPPTVAINQPFAGGYVLRRLQQQDAPSAGTPIPSIMIEVNRGLFVGRQTTRTPVAPPRSQEIVELRRRLYRWLLKVIDLL